MLRNRLVLVVSMTLVAGLAAPAAVFAADAATAPQAAPKAKSLYDSLGGKTAITAVVDAFVANCAGDKRINVFFASVASDAKRLAKFKTNLVDQICEAAGGPCKYTGKAMKEAHAGMGVSSADFNALVEDLVAALDKFNVAEADKKTLLGVLGPMKADIVEN